MRHPVLALGACDHMHPVGTALLPCPMSGPALWLAQGPPTPASSGTYGWRGHGYNPISIGAMGQSTTTSTSWLSDPCHVMWLIAGVAAAAASGLTTYALRKKKKGQR